MTRITKHEARKAFNAGTTIRIVPVKNHPYVELNPATLAMDISNHNGREFDRIVNSYAFYHCTWETGYYPAFYI